MIRVILFASLAAAYIQFTNGGRVKQQQSNSNKIPSFIKICHRSDPNLDQCVMKSVEAIRPYLKNGIPELHIPACEPLKLPPITLIQGKGSINVKSIYNDMKIYGPSEFVLKSAKIDLDKDRIKIKLSLPKLRMIGNYTIEGKILMLPISGKGVIRGNYSDIDAVAVMQGEKQDKNGKTYFKVNDFFVDFSIGRASIHLSNLFNGDKQLGESMNEFLNENWRDVAQEIKPVLEQTIGELFKKMSNKVFQKYPLEELLPP